MRSNPQEYTVFYLFAYAFNVKAYHIFIELHLKKKIPLYLGKIQFM